MTCKSQNKNHNSSRSESKFKEQSCAHISLQVYYIFLSLPCAQNENQKGIVRWTSLCSSISRKHTFSTFLSFISYSHFPTNFPTPEARSGKTEPRGPKAEGWSTREHLISDLQDVRSQPDPSDAARSTSCMFPHTMDVCEPCPPHRERQLTVFPTPQGCVCADSAPFHVANNSQTKASNDSPLALSSIAGEEVLLE